MRLRICHAVAFAAVAAAATAPAVSLLLQLVCSQTLENYPISLILVHRHRSCYCRLSALARMQCVRACVRACVYVCVCVFDREGLRYYPRK